MVGFPESSHMYMYVYTQIYAESIKKAVTCLVKKDSIV